MGSADKGKALVRALGCGHAVGPCAGSGHPQAQVPHQWNDLWAPVGPGTFLFIGGCNSRELAIPVTLALQPLQK